MAEQLLQGCGVKLEEVDVIAVAAGPGSFTGLRIGVSAAKGLAWALDKPCAKVSTLEAMAWNIVSLPGELCPVMDARRSQVYNARFSSDGETVTRLTPDRAISLEELTEELRKSGKEQILVGDGTKLCYNHLTKVGLPVRTVSPNLRFQSAWGVARAALEQARAGTLISAGDLTPDYHRLSQAERERLARESKGEKEHG
jgi:tRNA threonylcarbamoyladenosine biosynthesis protein TsaB